ncbi:MAG: hypothetical protein ISP24_03495 [Rickettsiales bacterium]|nr:hypothetical protein [Rickettsiales bacterium]
MNKNLVIFLSLFTSISSLLCCALPALLVMLGFGSVFAALIAHLPWLVVLSKYKILLFIVSGLILILAFILFYRFADHCPVDKKQAISCARIKKFSRFILYISAIFYVTGFSFAFILPKLLG